MWLNDPSDPVTFLTPLSDLPDGKRKQCVKSTRHYWLIMAVLIVVRTVSDLQKTYKHVKELSYDKFKIFAVFIVEE